MSNLESILEKLSKLNETIQKAQKDLSAGRVTTLNHLDKEVSVICEEVVKLPPEDAKQTQAPMADMIGNLDTLALSLQSFQAEMKEKME